MSQLRPRKITRLSCRSSHAAGIPILLRVRCTLRLTCIAAPDQAADWNHQARRAALPSLLALLAIGTLGLLANPLMARAQTTDVPHDVTLRFQTPDVAHPNTGAKLQSMWGSGTDGWAITYPLTTGWNYNKTFGSFTDLKTPKINLKLFTIPSIDLGEWGAGGQVFTKATNTGLSFSAVASGGSVSVDYPVHVRLDAPKFIAPGAKFNIHVTYTGDSAARVTTLSPQAYASVNLLLNAQVYLNGRVEIASKNLFNKDIIDWCDRDDPQSPKYGQSGGNKGFHINQELFNTNSLVSAAAAKVTYSYPKDSPSPYFTAALNYPIINTTGQPGSASNYQSGAGGSASAGSGGASYEYTTGITTPVEVVNNSNATYARGQDNVINLTADFTNMLTDALDLPPLNYSVPLEKYGNMDFGLLDLQANLGLGFLQEFAFIPKPTIHLMIGDTGGQTAEYTIDPINGVDIPVQMPNLPPGADAGSSVSVKVTPIVTMSNDFISNTYLDFNGGLTLDPVYLDVTGKGGLGSYSFQPLNFGVGVDIPLGIYKTTFPIPFNAQTGDAYYVTTATPPLASLASIYPSLLYVNENEISGGYGVGVSSDLIALHADTTIVPPNTFAGGWFRSVNSGTSGATALTYNTKAYWDKVADNFELKLYPDGQTYSDATWDLLYKAANTWVDLTPGIHHVYAANSATSGGATFGPRITSLPLPVAYPPPYLEMLAVQCSSATPGAKTEFKASNGLIYQPLTYDSAPGHGANLIGVGPIMAGSPGFTLLAIDHSPFNDPDADKKLVPPWSVGGFSRIKFDGKLLARDPDLVYSNVNTTGNGNAYPFTSGQIPTSMIARAGYHAVQVANPAVGGKGGDSNTILLHVINPAPVIGSVTAVKQNTIVGSNTVIESSIITAGSPDTRLKIIGAGLTPDTLVYWRDTAHPLVTEFVNANLMYATLPAAQITMPQANHTLYVVNPCSTTGTQPTDGGSNNTTHLHLYAGLPHVTSLEVDGAAINALYLNSPNDVTVTIRGDHFWPGVTANWRGNPKVTFVDEQTLTATIPASSLSSISANLLVISGTDYDGNRLTSPPFILRVVYAPPVLASLGTSPAILPLAVQVGAAAPALALTGGLFYPGSRVTVGGKDCAVTFVDTMHLQAVVPVGVADAIGSYPVVVTNPTSTNTDGTPAGDGGVSNAMPFQVLKYAPQAQLTMTANLTRLNPYIVRAQITMTNTGMADANGIVLQSAGLGSATAKGTLPGSLAVGQSATLTLLFSLLASARGTLQTLKLTGTLLTGGQSVAFSSSVRVQVP